MPTDNPKISLYVPQQVYDRFKEFQQKQDLSMSQAGIVILAEYFGIKETVKEITEGTTIGGVTLADFQELKDKVQKLEYQWLNQKVDYEKTTSSLLTEKRSEEQNLPQETQLEIEMLSDQQVDVSTTLINVNMLARRLGYKNKKSVQNKKSFVYKQEKDKADSDFLEWTTKKDRDEIGWLPIQLDNKRTAYFPPQKISSELASKLREWITQNKDG